MADMPRSQQAEEVVVGSLLSKPDHASEIVGALLPEHFYFSPYRIIYEQVVEAHYADDPIDPITIAEPIKGKLAKMWQITEVEAVDRVFNLSASPLAQSDPLANARTIREKHDLRSLVRLASRIQRDIESSESSPEVLASELAVEASRIATDRLLTHEIVSFGDLGRRWLKASQVTLAAKEQGIELAAYFGMPWIDDFTAGIKPTELAIIGGEAGVGKSAVAWEAFRSYALRQQSMQAGRERQGSTEDRRIAALILSMEMGEEPSSNRVAQAVGGIDGAKIRTADVTREELIQAATKWAAIQNLPLYLNHAGQMKASQMKALIVEAIDRHNVGLVLIDHFRYFDMDRRPDNANEHDDDKVRFLKQGLAKELNIAVVCLSHLAKSIERLDKRPRLSDLRGSAMISAEADFVGFVYRPWKYASEKDRETGRVRRTDMELIWEKNRHGQESSAEFYANLSTMQIV